MSEKQTTGRGRGRPPTRRGMVRVFVHVLPDERDGLKAAARAAGLSLAQWCRARLNTAVVRDREVQS